MMDRTINKAFLQCHVNGCLQPEGSNRFGVKEDKNSRSYITKSISNAEFVVENNTSNPIKFLAIDACILTKAKGKRCDFALYNEKECCFIELKCNTSTGMGIQKRGEDAIKQIVATISNFENKNVDFSRYRKLEAYIVFAKKMMSPNSATNFQMLNRKFRKQIVSLKVKVELIKGNRKIF